MTLQQTTKTTRVVRCCSTRMPRPKRERHWRLLEPRDT